MDAFVDLSFPVQSQAEIPADHSYVLFAALSRTVPELHGDDAFAVHPIAGRIVGDRRLQLCEWSRLTIRCPANNIAKLLPLAGKQIVLSDHKLRIGVPQVQGLISATSLRSRLVTTKNGHELERFRAEIQRQLAAIRVPITSIQTQEERRTQPEEAAPTSATATIGKRRTVRIKDKEVVGYELILEGLSSEESLTVQQIGLGGRRHLGCGVFVPFRQGRGF